MNNMTVKDGIVEVKNFLLTHEWIQGKTYDGRDGYCITGAARTALLGDAEFRTAMPREWDERVSQYYRVVSAIVYAVDDFVPVWNDTPGRTKQEVLDMLDHAAVECGE